MPKNTLSDMPQNPDVRLVVYHLKCVRAHRSKAAFSVIVKTRPNCPTIRLQTSQNLLDTTAHFHSNLKQSECILCITEYLAPNNICGWPDTFLGCCLPLLVPTNDDCLPSSCLLVCPGHQPNLNRATHYHQCMTLMDEKA